MHIPRSFTPELLALLAAMGHGEELLLGDGNFPFLSTGGPGVKGIQLPTRDIGGLLEDILYFFPLDETVEAPLTVMESAKESGAYQRYREILSRSGLKASIGVMERFAFYGRAAKAAGIVISADTTRGGNVLLKKGVIRD
ncbi:MAG: fucose isomerase [Treponema sp.]|jgi:L-fucose mutarotase|nr:fucose isomerase [Treponema sp.]